MTDQTSHPLPDWLNVSRETSGALTALAALVEKWNPAINLVSKASLVHIWDRHVLDSAQLFALSPATAKVWVDLGSGGGFPGLVVAVLAKEVRPQLRVVLLESDRRKATFLSEAARLLDLSVDVLAQRIGEATPQEADVVSARALGALAALCGHARRHLATGGMALFPKGAQCETEIAHARLVWQFNVTRHASRTDPEATILAVTEIENV